MRACAVALVCLAVVAAAELAAAAKLSSTSFAQQQRRNAERIQLQRMSSEGRPIVVRNAGSTAGGATPTPSSDATPTPSPGANACAANNGGCGATTAGTCSLDAGGSVRCTCKAGFAGKPCVAVSASTLKCAAKSDCRGAFATCRGGMCACQDGFDGTCSAAAECSCTAGALVRKCVSRAECGDEHAVCHLGACTCAAGFDGPCTGSACKCASTAGATGIFDTTTTKGKVVVGGFALVLVSLCAVLGCLCMRPDSRRSRGTSTVRSTWASSASRATHSKKSTASNRYI